MSDDVLRNRYNSRYPAIKAQWDEYERHLEVWKKKRAKRAKYTQEMVVIRSVNDEFKVHGHMLKDRSTFFRREIEKPGEAVIRFPDEDDVVAAYVHCVYEGEIQTELSEAVLQAQEEAGIPGGIKAEFTFLAQLYVFGEKIQVIPPSHDSPLDQLTLLTCYRTTPSATKSSHPSQKPSTNATQLVDDLSRTAKS